MLTRECIEQKCDELLQQAIATGDEVRISSLKKRKIYLQTDDTHSLNDWLTLYITLKDLGFENDEIEEYGKKLSREYAVNGRLIYRDESGTEYSIEMLLDPGHEEYYRLDNGTIFKIRDEKWFFRLNRKDRWEFDQTLKKIYENKSVVCFPINHVMMQVQKKLVPAVYINEGTQNVNLRDYQHLTEGYELDRKWTYMIGLVDRGKGRPPVIEKVPSYLVCDTRWGHTFLNLNDKQKKFTEILLPETLEEIGEGGCYGHSQLKKIYLPDNLKKIEQYAFQGCSSLTKLLIPDKVNYIGWGAFVSCTSLEEILVDEKNEHFESVDGVLFSKGRKKLYAYPSQKKDTEYWIPETVEEICHDAFQDNHYLRHIHIPSTTSKICGQNAFVGCGNLREISVDAGNETYESDDGVLLTRGKLRLLLYPPQKQGCVYNIPSEVTEIDQYAFQNCRYLMHVTIPPNVSKIDFRTFDGCSKLVEVLIPDSSLKYIFGCAFRNCTNLRTIRLPETLEDIGNSAFENCESLKSIYLPAKLRYLWGSSFEGCISLSSVQVSPDNETFGSNGRCVYRKNNNEVVFSIPGLWKGFFSRKDK